MIFAILDEDEKKLLEAYILTKAMLGECEGWDPSFLKPGQTLWEWFGYETEMQCRRDLIQLREEIKNFPFIEIKLNQKEWFIEWKDGKYFLSYKMSPLREKLALFSNAFESFISNKEVRIFGIGVLVGATALSSIYAPWLLHKIFVFILCFCVYGLMAGIIFLVFLNEHLKKYLHKRYHEVLLIALFIIAISIAISLSLFMVGSIGKNPVSPEFDGEQTYP